MRFLIVGLGSIGKRHARNLRSLFPNCQLLALRRPLGPQPGDELVDQVVFSLEQALQWQPTAAVVAGPASHHLELAEQLLRSDIDVLVEKPLSVNPLGCAELETLCQDKQRILMLGYNLRFHPATLTVQRSLQDGDLGELVSARFEVGQYLPDWRTGDYRKSVSVDPELGGGVLLELSHELDLCRWLLGDSRLAFGQLLSSGQLDISVEDQANILLILLSGQTVSIHLDMLDRGGFRGCRLQGTRASLCWDHQQRRVELQEGGGQVRQLCNYNDFDPNETYLDEMRHFLECVKCRTKPLIGIEDGFQVLRQIEAIRKSHQNGGWQDV